ncbi:MAG: hypothetical protein ABIJ91_05135 [Candidatus Kuenenbacteria bacterium]
MSGIVTLSIDYNTYGKTSSKQETLDHKFVDDLFWLTFYHQHLGQEYSGLVTASGASETGILVRTHRGLFRPAFKNDLKGYCGPFGIGHISSDCREPYMLQSAFPDIYVCFDGNIINNKKIVDCFKGKGHGFERSDDVSIIARLIVETVWDKKKSVKKNVINGLTYVSNTIQGSFALAILIKEKIYVARGLDAHTLLVIGKKKGAITVCSESTSFFNQGFEVVRDVEPGEILTLKNGHCSTIGKIPNKKKIIPQPCSFKKIYTEFPVSQTLGKSSAQVRKEMGAILAKRDIEDDFFPDVVVPVPDSGRFHAIGYHQEFIRQAKLGKIPVEKIPLYDEILCKYPYSGRSYIPKNQNTRDIEANQKIIPIVDGIYKGMIVVVVEDSVVRGTQSKNNLIPKIKATGAREIHLRVSNPKLVGICPWGKSTKKKEELAALDIKNNKIRTDKEIAAILGINSVKFCTVDDIGKATGIEVTHLCTDCSRLKSK